MKAKTLLPIIALCIGGSLGSSPLFADGAHTKGAAAGGNPFSISRLIDTKVKDAQGDTLGTIKDVVFDPASGRPTFAVIKLSGNVGQKGAYAPVPWTLLWPMSTVQTGEPKTLTLNVNRDQFASAQRFNLQQWPDYNQATWGPQVYSYYGLDYGTIGGMGAPGSGTTIEKGTGTYYYRDDMGKYGPTRANGMPIDNGTAPDGKGTFVHGIHY